MQRFFWVQHIWSRVFSAMALFVLLLAAVGVYGVMSLSVSRRELELGIWMALGADPGGSALCRLLGWSARCFFGSQSLDLVLLSSVIAILVVLGLVAGIGPARRAASADPIVALRTQ